MLQDTSSPTTPLPTSWHDSTCTCSLDLETQPFQCSCNNPTYRVRTCCRGLSWNVFSSSLCQIVCSIRVVLDKHGNSSAESITDLVKVLSTQAFEFGSVPHDPVHRPLGKEELMQAVVGDLGNGGITASSATVSAGAPITRHAPFNTGTRGMQRTLPARARTNAQ